MATPPQNIVNAIKPYVNCPNPLWEGIVQFESGFNQYAVGDNGTSFGLFQLHIGGQANAALQEIQQTTGLTGWQAYQYLMQNVPLQAKYGMPPINDAWNNLKSSFDVNDSSWWIQFCVQSGHPGGSASDPVTQAYVTRFMQTIVNTNMFGIQQISPSDNGNPNQPKQDNTWLQALINMPPEQPCNVIWRRSCPGAKAADEGGMDLPSPNGTKVYALGAGQVIGAGYFYHPDGQPGYGVVTIRTPLPDGTLADIYYQHIQLSPSIILCGQTGGQLYGGIVGPVPTYQTIQQGQFLGTVVVGEVEVGVNADWGGIWGTNHPGPWLDDPESVIRSLMSTGGGVSPIQNPVSTGNDQLDAAINEVFVNVHAAVDSVSKNPGLAGPIQAFDTAQQFVPFSVPDNNSSSNPIIQGGEGIISGSLSYPTRLAIGVIAFIVNNVRAFIIRSIFVLFAIVVIIALIINLTSKVTESSEEEDNGSALSSLTNPSNIAKVAEVAAL